MICLVDANNFFVSCERVFQPNLANKPVIVLSNNDGCAIARSNEAKALGIKMGQPYFEIKHLCEQQRIHVFSSNYTLYGDMSNRLMAVLKNFAVNQEIYSIDESFLDLTGIPNLTQHGQKIRTTVNKHLGLPVCVGIGQTKVLAKLANYLAKKYEFLSGVCNLAELGTARTNKAMEMTAIDEVWGVGRKLSDKLKLMGIRTVYDLKQADPKQLGKRFSVNIERIVYELNEIPCLTLENYATPNQQIISSRSFGTSVTDKDSLLSSLTYHVEQISRKLRKQQLYARQMLVFAHTNRFNADYLAVTTNIILPAAIDSFRYMARHLEQALEVIYKPHIAYKKAGIIITDLISSVEETRDLFDRINIKHDELLPTLENIKKRFGKFSIQPLSSRLSATWKMQQSQVSQRYTTDIDEILEINLK